MFKSKKIRRSREFNKNNQLIDFEKAREARKEKREGLAQTEEKEKPSQREVRKKNRKRNFYAAALIAIVVIICISAYQVISVRYDLAVAQANREALEAEHARLEHRLENIDTPEFIEYRARTLLRMIRPGEIYYVIPINNEN